MEPYWYAAACGGDVYDIDKYFEEFEIPYTQLIFKSMFTMSYYMEEYSDKEIHGQWDDLNYTPEVENITIPGQEGGDFYEILRTWGGEGDLDEITGIGRKLLSPLEISVYPNPTDGWIHLEMAGNIKAVSLVVRDMTGRVIVSRKLDDGPVTSLFLGAKPGLYLAEVHTREGVAIRKIIRR